MGHREQNSSCPVTWDEEPRGFLTEWEATPLEPTEDAGNMLAPMWLFDHVAACIRDGKATEEMAQNIECLRGGMEAQAARIAELEALVAADFDMLDSAWKARAETAEAALAEAEARGYARGLEDANTPEHKLAEKILAELVRARTKFPGKNVTFAALVEEVGELATATFEESAERVEKEAVQVAVMAMRMVLDGDNCFDGWRADKGLDPLDPTIRALAKKEVGAVFPPPHCTAWEDCNHDGICHDFKCCGATGPNHEAFYGEAGE